MLTFTKSSGLRRNWKFISWRNLSTSMLQLCMPLSDVPQPLDKVTLKPVWKSLISEAEASPAQKCSHCSHQTMGTKLVLSAPMAPLKHYLDTYDTVPNHLEDCDEGYDSDDEVNWDALNDAI